MSTFTRSSYSKCWISLWIATFQTTIIQNFKMYMALDANVLPYYMDPISFLLFTFEPKKTQINCFFIRSPERLKLQFKTIVNLSSSSSSPNPASPWVHLVLHLVLKHAQQWAFLQHVGVGRTWLPLVLKPKTTYTAVSTNAKLPSRYPLTFSISKLPFNS